MGPELQNTDLHRFLNLLYDLILERGFAEDVVWSYAGLTTVHVLSPGYASGERKQNPNQNTYAIQSFFHCHFVSQCIRRFAYCYAKTSGNSNWRKEGVILAHSWRVLHCGGRRSWPQDHNTVVTQHQSQGGEQPTLMLSLPFFFHHNSGLGWVFPPHLT